jgi:hypothetical protein
MLFARSMARLDTLSALYFTGAAIGFHPRAASILAADRRVDLAHKRAPSEACGQWHTWSFPVPSGRRLRLFLKSSAIVTRTAVAADEDGCLKVAREGIEQDEWLTVVAVPEAKLFVLLVIVGSAFLESAQSYQDLARLVEIFSPLVMPKSLCTFLVTLAGLIARSGHHFRHSSSSFGSHHL